MPPQAVCSASLLMGRPIACAQHMTGRESVCLVEWLHQGNAQREENPRYSGNCKHCQLQNRCQHYTGSAAPVVCTPIAAAGVAVVCVLSSCCAPGAGAAACPTCTPKSPMAPTFSPSVTDMVRTFRSGQFLRILHTEC
jgi:hypothetical protein